MNNSIDRFIYLVEYIFDNKLVKNKKELAGILNITPQKLFNILAGRMRPNAILYDALVQNFPINPEWLLTGQGEMLRTEAAEGIPGNCQEIAEKLIETQSKLIQAHEKILELTRELEATRLRLYEKNLAEKNILATAKTHPKK